jgi:pimeloyl-ACP methyl ester carboxylesterase
MKYFIYITMAVIAIVLLTAYICFVKVFITPKRKKLGKDEYDFPPGEIYEPFYPQMKKWTDDIRSMKRELVQITSFDGLKLRGYYYEYSPNSPLELIFHGYGGNAERDLSGGVERCFALGRSAILIDQRGAGMSEGRVCSFGINERRDCLEWIKFATAKFGRKRPIIIGGVSMGAATVMMAAGEELPPNVIGVLADCGYTSAKEIICKVIRQMRLPVPIFYPIIRLSGRLFGGFDIEETSPMEAMRKCRVPVIFYHGEADDFVPCDMSVRLHKACVSTKRLVIVPGADHGLAYPADKEGYLRELRDFEVECGHV